VFAFICYVSIHPEISATVLRSAPEELPIRGSASTTSERAMGTRMTHTVRAELTNVVRRQIIRGGCVVRLCDSAYRVPRKFRGASLGRLRPLPQDSSRTELLQWVSIGHAVDDTDSICSSSARTCSRVTPDPSVCACTATGREMAAATATIRRRLFMAISFLWARRNVSVRCILGKGRPKQNDMDGTR
jgi:hypothetical protein